MDLGLERVTQLLNALAPSSSHSSNGGHSDLAPHHVFPIIHVAGTNGKGSICAYLSSILQASGFRVGRYNSPHLINPRDTIQVNNQPISQEDYDYVSKVVQQKDAELGLKATSFELLTATAFYWFAYGRTSEQQQQQQQRVDIAVIEVGVGGRLDATNIVPRPKVCVVASIGMDHGALLGDTIEKVTFEKAGIIKEGVPVVIAPQAEGDKVYRVLEDKAKSVALSESQIVKVSPAHWITAEPAEAEAEAEGAAAGMTERTRSVGQWAVLEDGFKFWIPLLGDFQLENAATAISAIRALRVTEDTVLWSEKITNESIRKGMRQTIWPGRLQWIEKDDAPKQVGGRMLVDGAHNPAAAVALRSYVDKCVATLPFSSVSTASRPRLHWIMAFTKGKDIEEMFDILFPTQRRQDSTHQRVKKDTFSAVEFSPPEGMPWVSPIDSQEVCDRLRKQQQQEGQQESQLDMRAFGPELMSALEWVGKERKDDDVVVLCGSLYLVADLFRLKP
ncbi:folylpolyglutamate synthase [Mortierella claussenii]|nr:folylpolyglutamate synthase [Mortierella claussenii]